MGEMSEEILGFTLGKPHESDDVKWIPKWKRSGPTPVLKLVITSASLPSQPLLVKPEKSKKNMEDHRNHPFKHPCLHVFLYLQNVDFPDFPHRMRPTGCWSPHPHPATCPKAQQFAMTVGDIHSSAA